MRRMPQIIETHYKGDRLSNEECIELRDRLKEAADALVGLGPVFHCAFKEANTLYMRAAEICKARSIGQIPKAQVTDQSHSDK